MASPNFIRPDWVSRFQGVIARTSTWRTVRWIVGGYFGLALGFAVIYWTCNLIKDDPGFFECFYFSIVTQTTLGYGDFHPINGLGMGAVVLQATAGLFLFAVASALMVFKLMQPSGQVFRFDQHAIFYPEHGILRIRVLNQMPATVSNIEVRAFLRTWLPADPQGRFATFDVPLKRVLIPQMPFLEPWNIATKPAHAPGRGISELEGERVLEVLSPLHITERSRVTVTLLGHVDQLKSTVSGSHSYSMSEITCGQYRFIDPEGLTTAHAEKFRWDNWDQFDESASSLCESCRFIDVCSLPPRARFDTPSQPTSAGEAGVQRDFMAPAAGEQRRSSPSTHR